MRDICGNPDLNCNHNYRHVCNIIVKQCCRDKNIKKLKF